MGTPDFAVPALRALLRERHAIVGLFTQPDRPTGRGLTLQPPPVKRVGIEQTLPVWQPQRLRDPEAVGTLRTLDPDLIVVVAYGQILSPEVLAIPRHGCINVHASLLPRWRGAAPIQRALLAGDAVSGVTIMQMAAGLDTGPILSQRETPLAPTLTGGQLHDLLAEAGADLLVETIRGLQAGTVQPQPQPADGVTYAAKLTRQDGAIDWQTSAIPIERQIRALHPWPGAWTTLPDGGVVKVLAGRPGSGDLQAPPGQVVARHADGIEVACGVGSVILTELQSEGRKRLPAREWAKGRSGAIAFGRATPASD
ncbi:MAG: methionyl-tRNA formyltransferase [Magnetococcales bacterium]|nr:methionyl-tRNA formyltransferase [Magnetococcales bacterium]